MDIVSNTESADDVYRLTPSSRGRYPQRKRGDFRDCPFLRPLGVVLDLVRARRALRASDKSGIELIQHAREGDGFANVFQAADPGNRAFDAHPEARMRHGTELAQIQVPFERFFRKPMLL